VSVPCSSTPARSQAPGHCGAATRPSVEWTTSAPAMMSISGLIHTARSLAVYASQCRLPEHHARLASGRWPSSAGRGWLPAGFQRKVSACGFPLSQAFLAHPLLDSDMVGPVKPAMKDSLWLKDVWPSRVSLSRPLPYARGESEEPTRTRDPRGSLGFPFPVPSIQHIFFSIRFLLEGWRGRATARTLRRWIILIFACWLTQD
jgi:hypothetical protein